MTKKQSYFRIVGVTLYSDAQPAFALPVVSEFGSERYFVQIMSYDSQKISGFSQLEGQSAAEIDFVDEILVKVGDPYIHAFIDKHGELYLNTAEELRSVFNVVLNDTKTSLVLKIQICDQIIKNDVRQQSRRKLLSDFSLYFGSDSAHSYENSSITAKMWNLLERAASSDDARARIQHARKYLIARGKSDGSIEVDLSAIDISNDLEVPVADIVAQLSNEFRGAEFYNFKMPRVNLESVGNLHDPTAGTIVAAVKLSPRQEERLAILIRAILLHSSAGMAALSAYDDSAMFTRSAVQLIRDRLQTGAKEIPEEDKQGIIAQLVSKLFAGAYPMRRGELLYYLAVHLWDFPEIRSAIVSAVENSKDRSLDRYRDLISDLLFHEYTK